MQVSCSGMAAPTPPFFILTPNTFFFIAFTGKGEREKDNDVRENIDWLPSRMRPEQGLNPQPALIGNRTTTF